MKPAVTVTCSVLCWAAASALVFFVVVSVTGGDVCFCSWLPVLQSSSCTGTEVPFLVPLLFLVITSQTCVGLSLPMCFHPSPLEQDSPWKLQSSLLYLLITVFILLFFFKKYVSPTISDVSSMTCFCSHVRPDLSIWFSFSLLAHCSLKQMFSPSFSSYIWLFNVTVFTAWGIASAGETLNISVLFNKSSVLLFTLQSQYFLHKLFDPFQSHLADRQPCPTASHLALSQAHSSPIFHTAFQY